MIIKNKLTKETLECQIGILKRCNFIYFLIFLVNNLAKFKSSIASCFE